MAQVDLQKAAVMIMKHLLMVIDSERKLRIEKSPLGKQYYGMSWRAELLRFCNLCSTQPTPLGKP